MLVQHVFYCTLISFGVSGFRTLLHLRWNSLLKSQLLEATNIVKKSSILQVTEVLHPPLKSTDKV